MRIIEKSGIIISNMNPNDPNPAAASGTPLPATPPVYVSPNTTSEFAPPTPTADTASPTATPEAPTPLAAADGDLIEKAWVDKVEQVIDKNKFDPHQKEEDAEALNQDYLKQRFGLDVSKPTDKK